MVTCDGVARTLARDSAAGEALVTARVRRADDPEARAEAAAIIRRGGLVAFPTETVYGLGADALDAAAVARIFEAKARPTFDPLIVHLPRAAWLPRVVRVDSPRAERLAARFWPGPLTLILPKRPNVPDLVTAGRDTVGVRVPDHPAARALIEAADTPLAAPSANPFGYVSPTTADHVVEMLGHRVDLVLDGGPCRLGIESTILALDFPARILRPGAITREEIEDALGERVATAAQAPAVEGASLVAPGQLERHYATHTPLRLLTGRATAPVGLGRVGLLAYATRPNLGFAAVEVLCPDGRPATAAANLFAALRRLDEQDLDVLLAEPCPEEGIGLAIMDRLRRSAASRV